MFDSRQKGDYGDFFQFKKEKIGEWLSRAEKFFVEIDILIDKEMRSSHESTSHEDK